MYYLSNGTRSVITIRVRYSKKLVEDFAIAPGEELELQDRQFQLIEGDKTQCDVLNRLNIRHVNDDLADTNVEIEELISDGLGNLDRDPPVTLLPDQGNIEGVSTALSRADHVHNVPTAVPVSIGTSNVTGVANSFSRSDHVHDHGTQSNGDLHEAATIAKNGFMSSADKARLDGMKAGIVAAGSFAGNPRKFTVVFSTAFPDTNYTLSIVGIDSRSWTYENKNPAGFTINTNANQPLVGEVSWQAIRVGE